MRNVLGQKAKYKSCTGKPANYWTCQNGTRSKHIVRRNRIERQDEETLILASLSDLQIRPYNFQYSAYFCSSLLFTLSGTHFPQQFTESLITQQIYCALIHSLNVQSTVGTNQVMVTRVGEGQERGRLRQAFNIPGNLIIYCHLTFNRILKIISILSVYDSVASANVSDYW